jgi:DNA-binding transcriptional LysR family regulator
MHSGETISWDDLRAFLVVARLGSFKAAGNLLGIAHTTVGRRISAIEGRIGARLLARHSKGMRLTHRGRELAMRLSAMETTAGEVERHLFGGGRELTGSVRIAVTDGLATFWLMPQLIAFNRAHPGVRIEIATVNSWGDLASEEADIALRYARPTKGSMVSRKVGRTHFALYGSQPYLDAFGTPATIDDLRRHTLIENVNLRTNRALARWQATLTNAPAAIAANAAATVLATVRAGGGIALLPTFFEPAAPELVMLDIPLELSSEMWMLSHAKTNKTPRVRALLTFIAECFARDRARWFF